MNNYDKLKYNPLSTGRLTHRHEELSPYNEFATELGDALLRYCILSFDEDSPFFKNRDLDDKKKKVFGVLNLKADAKAEIESHGTKYREVAFRWFSLHHSYIFEEWLSRKSDWHENNAYLAMPLALAADQEKMVAHKAKIKSSLESDRQALLNLENTLFSDDKTKQLLIIAANEAKLPAAEEYATNFFDELEEKKNARK